VRWKKRNYIGNERVITRFLFFPRLINMEYRWLEVARIKQIYKIFGWHDYYFMPSPVAYSEQEAKRLHNLIAGKGE